MDGLIAVLDRNGVYAGRLCAYINSRTDIPFRGAAFLALEAYRAFAQTHRVLVLLAETELIAGEYELGAEKVLRLCEEPALEEQSALISCDGAVYKYQSAEAILRIVLDTAGALVEHIHTRNSLRTAELISVFSPIGRCHKTAFALLYAISRARKERVLYLNFEAFSGLSSLTGETYCAGISDALYHWKQGNLDRTRLGALVHRFHNVDLIPPCRTAEDLMEAGAEDLGGFLDTVAAEMSYDCIVLDLGSFSAAVSGLIFASDLIYMPAREDPVSEGKLAEFDSYLEQAGKTGARACVHRIYLPEPGLMRGRGAYIDNLLLSPLGDYVRSLL